MLSSFFACRFRKISAENTGYCMSRTARDKTGIAQDLGCEIPIVGVCFHWPPAILAGKLALHNAVSTIQNVLRNACDDPPAPGSPHAVVKPEAKRGRIMHQPRDTADDRG